MTSANAFDFEQRLRPGETLGRYSAGQLDGGVHVANWVVATCYTAEARPACTWRLLGWTFATYRYGPYPARQRLDEVVIPEALHHGDVPDPWRAEVGRLLPSEEYGWIRIDA